MGNKIIDPRTIYKTKDNVEIIVSRGKNPESDFDFRVHYREPYKRLRMFKLIARNP